MGPGSCSRPLLLAALLSQLACAPASALPMSATSDAAAPSASPIPAYQAPEDLLRPDSNDSTAFLFANPASIQQALQRSDEWERSDGRSLLDARGAAPSLSEQLRSFVNVDPSHSRAQPQARPGTGPQRVPPPAFAGIDIGEVTDEWLKDTVRTLVDSTLRLEVDERGRASFSILGLGDFSLSVSGDRSQLALSQGGDALFVLDRPQLPPHAAAEAPLGPAYSARYAGEQPAIKQVVELVADVASHPISLLVYCVVAAYLLLWSVLSRQRHKPLAPARGSAYAAYRTADELSEPARAPHRTHSAAHAHTHTHTHRSHEQRGLPEAGTTRVRRRKRIRIRSRMHRATAGSRN